MENSMKRAALTLGLLTLGLLAGAAVAQERVDLTAPIAKTSTQNCALDYFVIDVGNSRIKVDLKCNNGDVVSKTYDATTTPTGASLLTALNTSNNSAGTSLIRRIYNRLTADGIITGTISGVPQ
jgi:hypothetical protein